MTYASPWALGARSSLARPGPLAMLDQILKSFMEAARMTSWIWIQTRHFQELLVCEEEACPPQRRMTNRC